MRSDLFCGYSFFLGLAIVDYQEFIHSLDTSLRRCLMIGLEWAQRVGWSLPLKGIFAIIAGFPENRSGFLARFIESPANETHLPTLENQARANPRFPGSHENPWWPRRDQRQACQRPQAPGSLTRRQAGRPGAIDVQRLKTRAQFQALLAAQIVARTPHFALHRRPLPVPAGTQGAVAENPMFVPGEVCIGAMVPKRWARRAVTRNFLKRQIYQVSARHPDLLPPAAHLVRLRAAIDRRYFVSAASTALRRAVADELTVLFKAAAGNPAIGQCP
jgi:ribonuclease P protein component